MNGWHSKSPFDSIFLGQSSVSSKLHVWESELQSDSDRDFILDGLKHGFRISDISHHLEVNVARAGNHPSVFQYHKKVK